MARSLGIKFISESQSAIREINRLIKAINDVGKATDRVSKKSFTLHPEFLDPKGNFRSLGADLDRRLLSRDPFIRKGARLEFMSSLPEGVRRSGQGSILFGKYYESLRAVNSGLSEGSNLLGVFSGKLVILGTVLLGLKKFLSEVVRHGVFIEDSITSLTVLYQNEERARHVFRQAQRFNITTPFRTEEILAATRTSAQYGVNDIFSRGVAGGNPNVSIAQILAGLGSFQDMQGNTVGMERAAQAIFRGNYRLMWPFRGLVQGAHRQALQAGQAGSPEYIRTMVAELSKIPQIFEMAEARSNTISGMWSSIMDFVDFFFIHFGGADESSGVLTFWSQLRDIIKDIRDWVISAVDVIREPLVRTGAMVGSFLKMIWDSLKGVFKIVASIKEVLDPFLTDAVYFIFELLGFTFRVIGMIGKALGDLISAVIRLARWFLSLYINIDEFGARFSDWVLGMIERFQMWGIALEGFFNSIKEKYRDFIDFIIQNITRLWNFLTEFYNRNRRIINAILTLGMSEAYGAIDRASGGAVSRYVGTGANYLGGFARSAVDIAGYVYNPLAGMGALNRWALGWGRPATPAGSAPVNNTVVNIYNNRPHGTNPLNTSGAPGANPPNPRPTPLNTLFRIFD